MHRVSLHVHPVMSIETAPELLPSSGSSGSVMRAARPRAETGSARVVVVVGGVVVVVGGGGVDGGIVDGGIVYVCVCVRARVCMWWWSCVCVCGGGGVELRRGFGLSCAEAERLRK